MPISHISSRQNKNWCVSPTWGWCLRGQWNTWLQITSRKSTKHVKEEEHGKKSWLHLSSRTVVDWPGIDNPFTPNKHKQGTSRSWSPNSGKTAPPIRNYIVSCSLGCFGKAKPRWTFTVFRPKAIQGIQKSNVRISQHFYVLHLFANSHISCTMSLMRFLQVSTFGFNPHSKSIQKHLNQPSHGVNRRFVWWVWCWITGLPIQ